MHRNIHANLIEITSLISEKTIFKSILFNFIFIKLIKK